MQRILVIGCAGTGKSTLARAIGSRLDLPVIHLDQHFWRDGWVPSPRDEFRASVALLASGERWVMDGNYSSTLDLRIPRADIVIWTQRSRWQSLWRVLSRTLRHYRTTRADMAANCPERFDVEFTRFIWSYDREHMPRIAKLLEEFGALDCLTVIKTDKEADTFLQSLPQA